MADPQFIKPNPLLALPPGDAGAIAPPSTAPIDPSAASIAVVALPEEPIVATLVEDRRRSIPGPGFLAAVGWTALLLVFQFIVVIFLAIPLVVLGVPPDQLEGQLFPIGTATILLLALGLALALFRRRTPRVLGLRRLRAVHAVLVLLTVLPLAILASEAGAWAGEVLPSLENTAYEELATWPYAFVLFVGCVLPAIGEEIYFRGFIGRGLLARYGMIVGTVLSSLLFGLVHIDPPQAIGVMVMGVTLQGVFVATRSLFAPMLLHGLNNVLSFTVLKYDEPLADSQHSSLSVVLTATVALVMLGVLFYQMRTRWISADGSEWSPGYVTGESPPTGVAAECRIGRPTLGWLGVAALAYAAFICAVRWTMTDG